MNCAVLGVPSEDRCAFILNNTESCSGNMEGLIHWTHLEYCYFGGGASGGVVIALLCVFFLYVLTEVTDRFFCASLFKVIEYIKIPPSLAGVTLFAIGNSAPEIASVAAASSTGAIEQSVGEVIGGALFMTTIITSAVVFAHKSSKTSGWFVSGVTIRRRWNIIRDIVFLLISICDLVYVVHDSVITMYEAISFLVIYLVYVATAVLGHWIDVSLLSPRRFTAKSMRLRGEHGGPASIDRYDWTIGTDSPEDSAKDNYDEVPVTRFRMRQMTEGRSNNTGDAGVDMNSDRGAFILRSPDGSGSDSDQDRYDAQSHAGTILDAREHAASFVRAGGDDDGVSLMMMSRQREKGRWGAIRFILGSLKIPMGDGTVFAYVKVVMFSVPTAIQVLTIPSIDSDMYMPFLSVVHPFMSAVMLFLIFSGMKWSQWVMWTVASVAALMSLFALIVWGFDTMSRAQVSPNAGVLWSRGGYPRALSSQVLVLSSVMSVAWIYATARELVTAIQTLGLVMDISPSILGLTLLSLGNGSSDLIANVLISRSGSPVMALSACFASPLTTLLLGLGTGFAVLSFRTGGDIDLAKINNANGKPPSVLTPVIITSVVFVLAGLVISLIGLTTNRFVFSKAASASLTLLYVVFIGVEVADIWMGL